MKPAPFDYFAPATLDEALALLAEHGGDAKPLAGGQGLLPAMNFLLARPAVLVDLNRISELGYVRAESGVAIGAMTRQRVVERSDVVARAAPLLAEALPSIAHPQIRNRGTVGGSIAHADPSAELPAVMLALEARFRAQGSTGERSIPAAEFFKGMLETALAPGELLIEIALPPLPARSGTAFLEVARRHGDYALVGVAGVVTLDPRGRCQSARIACLSVGDGPVLLSEAGKLLAGQSPSEELLRAAADAAATRDIDPPSDIHASAAYRRQLARVLTRRALARGYEHGTAHSEEERHFHYQPGAHPDLLPWLLKKKIHVWGVDCVSTDHPMNLPIGRFLGKGAHGQCDKVRAKAEQKFGGKAAVEKMFPDSAYQLTHNALFPKDCIHIENLGGEIEAPELQNKRLIVGCFPWKFKGGEAAFCRTVAFTGEWKI